MLSISVICVALWCIVCQVDGFRLPTVSIAHGPAACIRKQSFGGVRTRKSKATEILIYRSANGALHTDKPPHRENKLSRLFFSFLDSFNRFFQWLFRVIQGKKSFPADPIEIPKDAGSSAFLTIPSTPLHKISNVDVGRQYAKSKLQEIDSYFARVQRKYKTSVDSIKGLDLPSKPKRSITDLSDDEVKAKRVFVRCDLNVPLKNGTITDDTRIRCSLPTINFLRNKGAKVILASHLGRPNGTGYEPKYSLAPVAAQLSALLNTTVQLVPDCIGISVGRAVSEMQPGDVVLLENVRFYTEEEANDANFAHSLASHADVYVNDAFGTAHRAHSSTAGITKSLKPAVSGLLLQKEIDCLHNAVATPQRPFAAIVGGSKVSSKIGVIESLLSKVDKLVVGGAMVFTFLKARGISVGASLVEDDQLDLARRLEKLAAEKGVKLYLASDIVVADKFAADAAHKVVDVNEIPEGWMGLDIGPQTVSELQAALAECKTVIWNGPMGVFEFEAFANGTTAIATTLVELTDRGCVTIIGGGDSVAAVEKAGLARNLSHIFTGDGASLELLEGKELPGIAALDDKM